MIKTLSVMVFTTCALLIFLASLPNKQEPLALAQDNPPPLPHQYQMVKYESWIGWITRYENKETVCYTWHSQSISCMPKNTRWWLSTY